MFCINPLTRKRRSPVVSPERETLGLAGKDLVKREAGETVETEEEISLRSYGSVLRYQCGLARRFYEPDLDLEYDERNMTCNWNRTWTTRQRYPAFSLVQLRQYCSLIGRDLPIFEIF